MSEAMVMKSKDVDDYFRNKELRDRLLAAIPNQLGVARMIQLAITMIKASPALMACTRDSLLCCVMEAAELGLELNNTLGHFYMVPFKNTAVPIIGYRGFMHLVYQTGTVAAISAEIVRSKDRFKRILGTNRGLYHEPAPIPNPDKEDNWLGAYAVAELLTGKTTFEYLEASQILALRDRSPSWRSFKRDGKATPWSTDPEEMWRKSVIRKLCKLLQKSTTDQRDRLLRAVTVDEYAEKPGLLKATPEGFQVNNDYHGEPIEPTMEQQLQESIDIVDARKGKQSEKKPIKDLVDPLIAKSKNEPTKPTKPSKATIPPVREVNDALISTKQQTEIYNTAAVMGWKVPEEVAQFLTRHYKLKSVVQVRVSQLADILQLIRSGT